ncbi:hypothetical protein ACIQXF_02445 [Lysinibacillus sp. NPDC097231]|uniref:hypothetical protein n=1 Tax=Lysinibacillus sp. NPDC097231 TaxID=3364142 RepID=UPI0037F8F947
MSPATAPTDKTEPICPGGRPTRVTKKTIALDANSPEPAELIPAPIARSLTAEDSLR